MAAWAASRREPYSGVAVWSGGASAASADVWFLHAFADSHERFAQAFEAPIARRLRIFAFDLPGHGESPAEPAGLTIEEAARVWRDAIATLSVFRPVVLVAHSMAGIIATHTARLLERPPQLVVSIEGNLTLADAYFTGQAAEFLEPERFHSHFQAKVLDIANRDESLRQYSENVRRADPKTLWTLGRSVLTHRTPGLEFLKLKCPTVYYWDPLSMAEASKRFLAEHDVRQRKLEGLGHWPMIRSANRFYSAIEQDILG